ncbi:MAG: carboxypeptidase-like regulatory domain-containing protein [Caldilineaceae bacterium]
MSNYRNDKQKIGFISDSDRAFDQLIRAVTSNENDEISCAECRRYFPALYELEQQNNKLSIQYAQAVHHLSKCSYCATEYHMLCEAMFSYESGTLPELNETIQFDLSFLDPTPPLWLSDTVHQVHRLFTEVLVTMKSTTALFGTLPAPLTPQLTPSGAFRSADVEGEVQILILPDADAELSIQLAVGPVVNGKAAIVVKLLQLETTAPLGGIRVSLRNAHRQPLVGSMTGTDGTAIFERLPIGHYFIQVRYKQQDWEVPLILVENSRIGLTDQSIG